MNETVLNFSSKNFLAASTKTRKEAFSRKVPAVFLKDLISDFEFIDILKIDIEGAEFALIKNEPDIFWRTKTIIMEVHPSFGGEFPCPSTVLP